MRHIVVLGCGFGGWYATREFERLLDGRRRVQLTVVNDSTHFLYTPLLPNVASGELDISSVTFPVQSELAASTRFVHDRVGEIDLGRRVLVGDKGHTPFDYLLVAVGAGLDWQGHDDWKGDVLTCKNPRDGVRIREAVTEALLDAAQMTDPEARRRRLTFVFAGGGPTGVALAAELYMTLRRAVFPSLAEELRRAVRFIIVEREPHILPELPTDMRHAVREHLDSIGVEFRTDTAVIGRGDDSIELDDGECLEADNLVWCTGVRPPKLLANSGFDLADDGSLPVDDTLQLNSHSGIFAVGDCTRPPDGLHRSAQLATQQAPVAAHNLVADLSGRAKRQWTFEPHGEFVSLGRDAAVAQIGDTLYEGRAAWALYRLVYTTLMPSGLNKARLIRDWVINRLRGDALGGAKQLLGNAAPRLSSKDDELES